MDLLIREGAGPLLELRGGGLQGEPKWHSRGAYAGEHLGTWASGCREGKRSIRARNSDR